MTVDESTSIRLTQFARGGGCAAKLRQRDLSRVLDLVACETRPDVIIDRDHADDAAVVEGTGGRQLVLTADVIAPLVDDPELFGEIAATNAISDVYAMGGTPLFALALVGMPVDRLPVETIRRILEGGEDVCRRAGIPVAGGHTIDSVEPIYGLVAIGLVDPANLKRNAGARPGDRLVLGKPLGVGILSAALKKGRLGAAGYAEMIASTTKLNTPGIALGTMPGVHALTDVTGFGLAGHLLGICRASNVAARVDFASVPFLPEAADFVRAGIFTGASERNWTGFGAEVTVEGPDATLARTLLTDPQTSGGLLVACAPGDVDAVLRVFSREGFDRAAVVGEILPGPPRVVIG